MKHLTEFIEPEMLTKDLKLFNDVFGIETTRKAIRELGGVPLSIPNAKTFNAALLKFIEANFDKSDKEIADSAGICYRRVAPLRKQVKNTRF